MNIIKGDMSILDLVRAIGRVLTLMKMMRKTRQKVVPGLTGYCQAYFRNNASVREKTIKKMLGMRIM